MARVEGAIQLTLPEGSVAAITTTRAKKKGEPLAKPHSIASSEATEIVLGIAEVYRDSKNWEELFSGGRANLRPFRELVERLTDEQFEQFPELVDQITGEIPAEGRTMGSRQRFPADLGARLQNLAEEVRTLPELKRAS